MPSIQIGTRNLTTFSYAGLKDYQRRRANAYDDVSIFTEEADATKVSHKPLWERVRVFTPSTDGDLVRLRTENGMQEIVFTNDGSKYFDKGKLVRKWHRTSDK